MIRIKVKYGHVPAPDTEADYEFLCLDSNWQTRFSGKWKDAQKFARKEYARAKNTSYGIIYMVEMTTKMDYVQG